jgi:hypothetical protein
MKKQSQDNDQIYQYIAMSEAGQEARRSEAVSKGFLGGMLVAISSAYIITLLRIAIEKSFTENLPTYIAIALVPRVIGGLVGMRQGSPDPIVMGGVFALFTIGFCISTYWFLT